MTDLHIAPDAGILTRSFLLEQDEVTDLVGDRIYSTLPKRHIDSATNNDPDLWPAVRLTVLFGDDLTPGIGWHNVATVQFDVWGGSKTTAGLAARTLRAVCLARMRGVHTEGVVTDVRATVPQDIPDESFAPARPRFTFDLSVYFHP